MNYNITIDDLTLKREKLTIGFKGWTQISSEVSHPKVILYFIDSMTGEDRRLPLVMNHVDVQGDRCYFSGKFTYNLAYIFYKNNNENAISLTLNVLFEDYYEEGVSFDLDIDEIFYEDSLYKLEHTDTGFTIQRNANAPKVTIRDTRGIAKLWTWLMFLFSVLLTPIFLADALLAEAKLLPYKSNHTAQGSSVPSRLFRHVNASYGNFSYHKIDFKGIRVAFLQILFCIAKIRPQDPSAIGLISVRRNELSGNVGCVYDQLKAKKDVHIHTFLCAKEFMDMNAKELWQIARICAVSKVIAVDEYTYFLYQLDLRPGTKVVQLWHACGAFKTFGYTRLGKEGGTAQTAPTHRNYDYATVSSESVRIWYAEGFGIPTKNTVATGIARTDIFFDRTYKEQTLQALYQAYPMLKDRKVVLFAPTFRGNKREEAFYPMKKFDVGHFMDQLPDDYVMIIKHHPFVTERHPIPERFKNRVLDLSSESELNDLLFLTDLIITDYSSLVFEASLLNIPMLFYTFDLKEYIRTRDFYFNYETFIPGHFFYTQEEMEEAIQKGALGQEKIPEFREKFCSSLDGHSSERIADLLIQALQE